MTSPTSAPSSKSPALVRGGFTLVEMLVVVAVIALLAGIALPMLLRAYKQASITRAALDMQTITGALEAYKQDFGDYPRPGAKLGFIVLGRALLGPDAAAAGMSTVYDINKQVAGVTSSTYIDISPRVTSGVAPAEGAVWTANPFVNGDGVDGFGFRIRRGSGKVYGPYIDPGKFNNKNGVLLDPDGVPYLYYVASAKKLAYDGSATNSFYAGNSNPNAIPPTSAHWEYSQNIAADSSGAQIALDRFQAFLGDSNHNGFIDAGETARADGPFFLWGAGGDGNFGPRGTDKVSIQDCDDIISNSSGK